MAKEPKKLRDLSWLVENRSNVMTLALEIYSFDERLQGREDERERIWPVLGHLIGATFSLWRGVFLAYPERQSKDMRDAGRDLLGTVIETNSIGFPQDQRAAQWMAGYYHNNAILRLRELVIADTTRDVLGDALPPTLEGLKLGWYTPDRQQEYTKLPPTKQFELAFGALQEAFEFLQSAYSMREQAP